MMVDVGIGSARVRWVGGGYEVGEEGQLGSERGRSGWFRGSICLNVVVEVRRCVMP